MANTVDGKDAWVDTTPWRQSPYYGNRVRRKIRTNDPDYSPPVPERDERLEYVKNGVIVAALARSQHMRSKRRALYRRDGRWTYPYEWWQSMSLKPLPENIDKVLWQIFPRGAGRTLSRLRANAVTVNKGQTINIRRFTCDQSNWGVVSLHQDVGFEVVAASVTETEDTTVVYFTKEDRSMSDTDRAEYDSLAAEWRRDRSAEEQAIENLNRIQFDGSSSDEDIDEAQDLVDEAKAGVADVEARMQVIIDRQPEDHTAERIRLAIEANNAARAASSSP